MSPRTPKQFKEIREEKKNLIMDTALEHFANKGYHETTISHLARHAGISKGLMYNYFESKEELLTELIRRSVDEIYIHFDPDRDGYLAEEEFEFFIRKVAALLNEKKSIWRLFFQMMMQKEVREKLDFINLDFIIPDKSESSVETGLIPGVTSMISDYFCRKKENKPAGYDPDLEMEIFLMTLKGLAVTVIYSDNQDESYYKKMVDGIIKMFK